MSKKMNIRSKIIFVVMPLIITPLLLIGIFSALSARNGITRIATEFFEFKAEELDKYAENQWNVLLENELVGNPDFVNISKSAIESFAVSLIRSSTELIIALDGDGDIVMVTQDIEIKPEEKARLQEIGENQKEGWYKSLALGGSERVAQGFLFEPFQWFYLVTEQREAFYQTINDIFIQSGIILSLASFLCIVLLLIFTGYLTKPLRNVVSVMKTIISTNDLSQKVEVLYNDETGELGHTFNLMTDELGNAYEQIKGFALKAVIAQKKEQKIRNIFQKYVPKDVIDRFYKNPDAMLVGENRELAILFSDIRNFTGISEHLSPEALVESLNNYFSLMVDIIMDHQGVVDKYIGDAIMAFYGAPIRHEDDAVQSVRSGLEMLKILDDFNRKQKENNRPEFYIGIGINYGNVTVGNIGSEKKMDYTVIGDMVNVASRLENLTKQYFEGLIISEYVYEKIKNEIKCSASDLIIIENYELKVFKSYISMEGKK